MTREYILQNLEAACPIWFIDNPELRDHVISTLQDSLLIPKPKFQSGNMVRKISDSNIKPLCIFLVFYDYLEKEWFYTFYSNEGYFEPELELVEEK